MGDNVETCKKLYQQIFLPNRLSNQQARK